MAASTATMAPSRWRAPASPKASPVVHFAHESEAQVARLLDFYQVRYEYEPRTFELCREGDADPGPDMLRFTPDFYLPEYDVFLEVTTVKPAFARRKNRKIRRLRSLYPDVKIKLLGCKDVEALFQRGLGSDSAA